MTAPRITMVIALAALAGLLPGPAAAQEIYRWVDDNGVVNFSDRPPAVAEAGVSTLTLQVSRPAAYDPEQDLFNIQATLQRTGALREKLGEQRAARREGADASPPVAAEDAGQSGYGHPWNYPPFHPRPPFGHGDKPPRPDRPPPQPATPEDDTATWRPPGDAPAQFRQ